MHCNRLFFLAKSLQFTMYSFVFTFIYEPYFEIEMASNTHQKIGSINSDNFSTRQPISHTTIMAGTHKSRANSNKKATTNSPLPSPKAVKQKLSPEPDEVTTTSISDENNGATLSDNGFYNDEEVWIEIYYALLEDALSHDPNFRPPPMTEILLEFNAFFKGYKRPVGDDMPNADAVAARPRKLYAGFHAYVTENLGKITEQLSDIATLDYESNAQNHYRPAITPELLSAVISGTKTISSLTCADARPDTRTWIDKATERLGTRGIEIGIHLDGSTRHNDWHIFSHPEAYGDKIWDPQGIIRTYRGYSYQMAERHADAALGSALLFAAAVPPLGFGGDLRKLRNEDFDENNVRAAKRQRPTDGERRVWSAAEEDRWVEEERRLHENGVRLLAARKSPAKSFYERVEEIRQVAVKAKQREAGQVTGNDCPDVGMGGTEG
jgi:hypothetical protein